MQPAARNACPRSLIHDPVRTAGAVTGSGRFFLICFRNHGARQDGIGLDPRIANLGCEVRAETLFQRPEQRIPDRLIMLVPHPVGDVLDGKRPDCGQDRVVVLQTLDDQAERGRQFAALSFMSRLKRGLTSGAISKSLS